jgi:hypothetical protein
MRRSQKTLDFVGHRKLESPRYENNRIPNPGAVSSNLAGGIYPALTQFHLLEHLELLAFEN